MLFPSQTPRLEAQVQLSGPEVPRKHYRICLVGQLLFYLHPKKVLREIFSFLKQIQFPAKAFWLD